MTLEFQEQGKQIHL
jgi:hypothetical protein